MAFVLEDRVIETANSPGQGDFELLGATGDNRTFVFGIGDGNTTRYLAIGAEGWEIGIGTVSAGSPDRLLRPGTVTKNSAGNTTPVDFGGLVTVACIVSVEDVAWIDDSGILQAPQGAFRSPTAPGLVVERMGQQNNAVMEYMTNAGSLFSGQATPGVWAVGISANLATVGNRLFWVDGSGVLRALGLSSDQIDIGSGFGFYVIQRKVDDSWLELAGGTNPNQGGSIRIYGPDNTLVPDSGTLRANGTTRLSWGDNGVFVSQPGAGGLLPIAAVSDAASGSVVNFPIGHHVIVDGYQAANRNNTRTIRLDDATSSRYVDTGSGAVLSGTWRTRGRSGSQFTLMQRVA